MSPDNKRKIKKIVLILLVVILLFTYLHSGTLTFEKSPKVNIVLISWDGVQRNHLFELLSRQKLPNLREIIIEGNIVNITITDHYTDTIAGHAEMLTGYGPDITRAYSNKYAFHSIPEGYTIFERVENYFGNPNVMTIMITGKRPYFSGEFKGHIMVNGEVRNITNPYYNVKKHLDIFSPTDFNADKVGPYFEYSLELASKMPFFAFFHIQDPDIMGHLYGENSQEYEESIKVCDDWLGKIKNKLKELNLYKKTLIYVTSDHGFNEGMKGHTNAPYIFLATNDDLVVKNGDQRDIAPTLLHRMGLDIRQINPTLPGETLFSPWYFYTSYIINWCVFPRYSFLALAIFVILASIILTLSATILFSTR